MIWQYQSPKRKKAFLGFKTQCFKASFSEPWPVPLLRDMDLNMRRALIFGEWFAEPHNKEKRKDPMVLETIGLIDEALHV